MRISATIFISLLMVTAGLSQQVELDSLRAASLIVGTWVDVNNPIHIITFDNHLEDNKYKHFEEQGLKKFTYNSHWEYFTKDSAGSQFPDSSLIEDSIVHIYTLHGEYRLGLAPSWKYFSNMDSIGTNMILLLDPEINSVDVEKATRIMLLDNQNLKFTPATDNHPVIFKRE